jgi:hypothetical protein
VSIWGSSTCPSTTRLVSNWRQRVVRFLHRVVSVLVNDRTRDRSHFRSSIASAIFTAAWTSQWIDATVALRSPPSAETKWAA